MPRCEEPNTDPCGCGAGSDNSFFLGSQSGASVESPFVIALQEAVGGTNQYVRDNKWVSIPEDGIVSTTTFANEFMWMMPLIFTAPPQDGGDHGFRFTGVSVNVSAAATAGTLRAGIYADWDNPVLVADFGTPTSGGSLSTTGIKEWDPVTTVMHLGSFDAGFVAIAAYSVTGTYGMTYRSGWSPGVMHTTLPTALTQQGTAYRVPYTAGTLPLTVDRANMSAAFGPMTLVRTLHVQA